MGNELQVAASKLEDNENADMTQGDFLKPLLHMMESMHEAGVFGNVVTQDHLQEFRESLEENNDKMDTPVSSLLPDTVEEIKAEQNDFVQKMQSNMQNMIEQFGSEQMDTMMTNMVEYITNDVGITQPQENLGEEGPGARQFDIFTSKNTQ